MSHKTSIKSQQLVKSTVNANWMWVVDKKDDLLVKGFEMFIENREFLGNCLQ